MMYVNEFWMFIENENSSESKLKLKLMEKGAWNSSGNETFKEDGFYGKWLLFFSWEESWEEWKKIAIAVEDGKINSTQAKVSRQYEGNDYKKAVCCVYTSKKDIETVREQLRKMGFNDNLCYKTNESTEQLDYGHDSHLICENKLTFKKTNHENLFENSEIIPKLNKRLHWVDKRRTGEEDKWKTYDLNSSDKKFSLTEQCICQKETDHLITFDSYVNYWSKIITREYEGGNELSKGRYECLDCHECQTDFFINEKFKIKIKNPNIEEKEDEDDDIIYIITNPDKTEDRNKLEFRCFENTLNYKDWDFLVDNEKNVKTITLLCSFINFGRFFEVKKIVSYQLK